MRRFGGTSEEKPGIDDSHGRDFGDSDFPRFLRLTEPALLGQEVGDVFVRRRVGVEDLDVVLLAVAEALLLGVEGLPDGVEGCNVGLELVIEGEDGLALVVLAVLLAEEGVLGLRGLGFPRRTLEVGSCG